MNRRSLVLTALSLPAVARAQSQAISLVVPFAPGGSTDLAARILAERIGHALNTRMVVENRAGAGGAVGSEYVKRAAPDGSVLLFASASSHGVNPAVFRDLSYDATRDFAAIALTGSTPLAVMVPPQGAQDLGALRAQLQGGKGAYASAGAGSITHLAAELFLEMAGLKADHIPYRGGGPAMEAVAKGEVPFGFETLATLAGPAQDGRVRLLAIAAAERSRLMAGLPSLSELGLAGFDISTWNAILAPASLPVARQQDIAAATHGALAEPRTVTRLAELGVQIPPPFGPRETAAFIAAEIAKFAAIVQRAKLTFERS